MRPAFWWRRAPAVWCGAIPRADAPEQLAKVEDGEIVLAPQMLPGGDALLFTIAKVAQRTWPRWDQARVVVQSLRTGERKTVLEGGSEARFVSTGHLIYAVGGIVFAAPFDLDSRELRGEAVPVVEGVRRGTSGAMQLAVSDSGALVYLPGPTGTDQVLRGLAIGDRAGNITGLPVPPAAYSHVRVSPDGTRAALGVDDGKQASVLIYALNGTSAVQRLTIEGKSRFPVWSPDGQWIAFQSDRDGDLGIFRQRADGTGVAERLTTAAAGEEHVPESWSPDGRHLSFGVRGLGSRDGLGPLDADAGRQDDGRRSASVSSHRTDRVGVLAGRQVAGLREDDRRQPSRMSTAASSCSPSPPTGAVYQVPRQFVDFHPVWSAIRQRELVFTAAATAGQMVAVRCHHRGWRDLRDAGAVPRERHRRSAGERAAGLGHPARRPVHRHHFRHRGRDAEFVARDAPGPELVRGIEAAGSGAVADVDANRHAARAIRSYLCPRRDSGRTLARPVARQRLMRRCR